MRRLLLALLVALVPVGVSAQVVPYPLSQAPLFGLPAPQGSSTNPFTNISFTGQALGPSSCTAYSFTAAPTTGYGYNGTLLCLSVAGSNVFTVSASAVSSTVPYVSALAGVAGNFVLKNTASASVASTGLNFVTSDDTVKWQIASNASIGAGLEFNEGNSTATRFYIAPSGQLIIPSASLLSWGSSGVATPDVILARDAANTLAQRNGTNAQGFSLYHTYTNASNYERVRLLASSNIFYLITGAAGTGTVRDLAFGTGDTARWIITGSTGHLVAGADNTYDIGVSGATRPRNYFGAGIVASAGGFTVTSLAVSGTAPSGPVACTSPAVSWSNGTASFQVDVGTSCTGVSTLVITLPTATNGWECSASNTSTAARDVWATAWTTTSVTFTNTARTTGLATDWADGADIRIKCMAG